MLIADINLCMINLTQIILNYVILIKYTTIQNVIAFNKKKIILPFSKKLKIPM